MKKKSSRYNSPDAGGWMHACDSLFLARFRGLPCVICGRTHGWDGSKNTRSCGHHLHHKGGCRTFRYEERNILGSLCPPHHSRWNKDISPHSDVNALAVERFTDWMEENRPEQYRWWKDTEQEARKLFDKSWTYREMYEELGGEINKDGPMKDWKPKNHRKNVKAIEEQV